MRRELYLFGASGHGKVIVEIAELLNYRIKGFIDDNPAIHSLLKYPVFHEIPRVLANENSSDEMHQVVISIGTNKIRKSIAEKYSQFRYPVLIHSGATISSRAVLEEGTVVMAGVSINSSVRIGKHCIINTNASVDHDCVISDYVHISPNAALAGNVEVGEGSHVGIGACVIQGIKIGKWCTIGAGAVIIEDVPDGATVVGNPGRVL